MVFHVVNVSEKYMKMYFVENIKMSFFGVSLYDDSR
jgi:hypothetical protein